MTQGLTVADDDKELPVILSIMGRTLGFPKCNAVPDVSPRCIDLVRLALPKERVGKPEARTRIDVILQRRSAFTLTISLSLRERQATREGAFKYYDYAPMDPQALFRA